MKVAVVTGSIPTSGSPYTIAGPSGFGLPEGLVIVCGAPGDSIDSVADELWNHIGFASATAQTCEAAWVADNATASTSTNYKNLSYGDRIYTDTEAVNIDAVNGGGPVTDGWELALDSAPGAPIPYIALLIGDTGGLAVGHAVDTAAAVTGLGFTPSFGMFATAGQASDGSEDTIATLGFGVADSATADHCHNLIKRSTSNNNFGRSRSGAMVALATSSTADAWSVTLDSWDADGFSYTDASGVGDRFAYLVLDPNGATITVSVETTPGATGDASFDPGHVVQAIFGVATAFAAWPGASTNPDAGAAAFFAADGTTEACHAIAAEDGVATTNTRHEQASAVLDLPTDDGGGTELTATVADISDVTLNFATANARGFLLIAFEQGAGGSTPFEATYALPFEAVTGVSALAALPLEALGGTQSTVSPPFEAAMPVVQEQSSPFEALGAVSQTTVSHIESLLALALESVLPFEALTAAQATGSLPLESLQRAEQQSSAPFEALGAAQAAVASPFEALAMAGSTGALPLESLAGAAGETTTPFEALGAIESPTAAPFESLGEARATAALPFEALAGIAVVAVLPFEALSEGVTTVQATYALPFEALAAVAAERDLPFEAVAQALAAAALPFEAAHPVSTTASAAFEALGGVQLTGALPFEALAEIRALASLPLESLLPVVSTTSPAFEALAGAAGAAVIPFESLARVVAIVPIPFEAAGEAVQVSVVYALPFEALAAVLHTTVAHIESTGPFFVRIGDGPPASRTVPHAPATRTVSNAPITRTTKQ